jgi:ABC-type polysaccharide/polyol phosphate export permease
VVLGRTLSDLVRNVFVVGVMFGVGLLVGFSPQGGAAEIAAVIGLLLLMSFAFSWIGATVGLAVRNVEAVQSAGFIWLFPLTFASSAFVPTATMPAGLRAFAVNQPISQIVNAVRDWSLGVPAHSTGIIGTVWCVGILIVFVPLSVATFRRAAARS